MDNRCCIPREKVLMAWSAKRVKPTVSSRLFDPFIQCWNSIKTTVKAQVLAGGQHGGKHERVAY
jgi:hypothetical protein